MNSIAYDTFEDWYRARHKGVGASELAGILGLSRFHSPWSIWQRKVDKPEPPAERWCSKEAEAGHRHERTIAQWFIEDSSPKTYGLGHVDPGEFTMYWADGLPMFATPDRLLTDGDKEARAVLELKCAWYAQAKRFRKQFPLEFRCQVQSQMLCTELDLGYYAVLLNGMEVVWYQEERNEKFIAAMVKKVKRFWQHVTDRIPPPPDFSEATSRAMAAHYSEPVDEAVDLPDKFATYPVQREANKAKIKELERANDGMKNEVTAVMGNATIGRLPDGVDFTWLPDVRGRRTLRTRKTEE